MKPSTKKVSIVLFFFHFAILALSLQSAQRQEKQPDLETILKKCAEYCERLGNTVLFFVCKEKITEKIYGTATVTSLPRGGGWPPAYGRGTKKNVYVYDYQLYRKKNDIKEQRILIEENGEKKYEENAPVKTRFFKHEKIIFGPIGLLSFFWQPHYDYQILKGGKFKGDKTFIIEATPNTEYTSGHLYGKIWVRKSDFSILKIEWYQHSIGGYKFVEEMAKRLRAEPRLTLIVEYDFEKNKIRFPSKFSLDEIYFRKRGRRYQRSKTVVLYEDYKFFTVETDVKIKDSSLLTSDGNERIS